MTDKIGLDKFHGLFIALVIVVILFQPSISEAQVRFEITPYYGFLLSTNVRAAQGDFVVKDSPDYGIGINNSFNRIMRFGSNHLMWRMSIHPTRRDPTARNAAA